MNKPKLLPYFEIIFAVLSWGASFVATKVALRYAQPVTVVWLRFAIGVLVLGMAVLLRKQFALPSQKDLGYFALLGFLGITFHQWLQSTGLETAQATTTAWIIATTPIFIALLGWLILRETMVWGQIAGVFLAALGVLLVVTKGDLTSLTSGHFGAPGDFLILISAPNWAVFSVISRQGLHKYPATRMMFFVMLLGWLFSSILFFAGQGYKDIPRMGLPGWLGIAFLGIFCSGLAYIFWYDGLKALPASQVGVFLYIEPFVTVIVAALILGEPVLIASLAGGAAILVGVWLVNYLAQKKQTVPKTATGQASD